MLVKAKPNALAFGDTYGSELRVFPNIFIQVLANGDLDEKVCEDKRNECHKNDEYLENDLSLVKHIHKSFNIVQSHALSLEERFDSVHNKSFTLRAYVLFQFHK